MPLRIMAIAAACIFWSATAQAAQSGGGTPGGTNYSCDGHVCTCDGTYQDCKSMEKVCLDAAILCGGKCQCAMKPPPARTKPGQSAPKPGSVKGAPPTKMQ
jgi:hypothetical protein